MLTIQAMVAARVPSVIAHHCAEQLCHEGSEMQRLFRRIISHSLTVDERNWMIAFCTEAPADLLDDELCVVGWASVTEWHADGQVRMQLQGFVSPPFRDRGIATAMCVCLCHDMPCSPNPVAVFSDEFLCVARRLHMNAVQYKSVDDGWIGVAAIDGRRSRAGANEGGVHAAPPEVRSVPLALNEIREAT